MKAILGLLFAIAAATAGHAHTRSESHSDWMVDGRSVALTYTLSDVEAARITQGARPSDAQLLAYLLPRVGVTAGGGACARAAPPRAVLAASGFRRLELFFRCPSEKGITLHIDAMFDLVPTHVNLVQIQTASGDFVQEVATTDDREVALDGVGGHALEGVGFGRFVAMGILHIFTGIDHMSFLLGLVLIARKLRDLVFVVSGFTIGHSLTLALAVTGLIRPHAQYIDALVALTIALIGAENVALASRRPMPVALATGGLLAAMLALRLLGIGVLPPLLILGAGLFAANYILVSGSVRDAGRLRLVVALVFGLIHGFGFAADLLDSPIPRAKLAELLVGFNLGVEIGQLTLVLATVGLVAVACRVRLALPRPITVDTGASILVGLGMFWFVGRSF